jgi:hypothetical protein
MADATTWITTIAENEDLDPPALVRQKMSRDLLGLAFSDVWCIAVRKAKPTQLLLLHELAHLACTNKGHGAEFQQQLVEYVRKYVSITHAAELAQLLNKAPKHRSHLVDQSANANHACGNLFY